MGWTEAPADKRKPPANGHSPALSPPRHVSTLPESGVLRRPCHDGRMADQQPAPPRPAASADDESRAEEQPALMRESPEK